MTKRNIIPPSVTVSDYEYMLSLFWENYRSEAGVG